MRILFLCNSRHWGGAEMYVASVAEQLMARGHACWVAAPAGSPLLQAARDAGAGTVAFDIGPKLGSRTVLDFLLNQRAYRQRLQAFLEDCVSRLHIELVHLQFKKEQLLATHEAVRLGVPVVWTEHGPLPDAFARTPVALWAYRRAARKVTRTICVSRHVRDELARHGVADGTLDVCYNGVELPRPAAPHERTRLRRSLGFDDTDIVLGTTSRLQRSKGHRYLIDAMPAILERRPDCRLLIVGDGPMRRELEARADRLGCSDRIHFTGHRDDVGELLCSIDLHITTTLNEGLCYAALEAMAAGVPVIASNTGGVPEAVGDAGVLVQPASARAIEQAVLQVLDDPWRMTELGRRGRERIARLFTREGMITRTESLLNAAILAGPQTGTAAGYRAA